MSIKPDTRPSALQPAGEGRSATGVDDRFTLLLDGLRGIDAAHLATLASLASDVALLVDGEGVVEDIVFGSDVPAAAKSLRVLRGKSFADTVTPESQHKAHEILAEAKEGPTRWRELNHPAVDGVDRPIRYCAFPAGQSNHLIVVGRDLDGIAALQQRLVETQRSLEQDYWRRRQVETRYRLLFQVASEGVLIVDANNLRIVEANDSAEQLVSKGMAELVGQRVVDCFHPDHRDAVQEMLITLRGSGRAERLSAALEYGEREVALSALLLNAEASLQFLLRLTPAGVEAPVSESPRARQFLGLLDGGPDGVVIANDAGIIAAANSSFLQLLELASEEQVRGEHLNRWLGRTNVDVKVLLSNLREFGSLRHFVTRARGEYGADTEVEISASSLSDGGEHYFGFVVRDLAQRQVPNEPVLARATPKSIQHLTELVGRVPLKEVIRESSDIIERLCIEAALELTGDNRASAAEMLGLSRQSLYVKLRRHGLMNSDSDDR